MCQRINPKLQTDLESAEPITLKVRKNTSPIMPIKHGMAVYCPVSTLIHFHTAHMFTALMWFDDRLFTDLFNKGKTHIRNGCSTVKAALRSPSGQMICSSVSFSF